MTVSVMRGALVVDSTLAVPGHPGLWAVGDCAAVTDGRTGQPCPPTAQFAIRQAATLASLSGGLISSLGLTLLELGALSGLRNFLIASFGFSWGV